ncbi:binding-protein-dependent transport systems inner membrane component [[Actinomadura] parvosata subsp. kistnae]|uniref:Sugar ABC transporter permease n=1 Tax=[Actinomadura] parvosata subsp. kistnae TaxID=1909395 RepID=A0A1V0A6H2_9ACTN|nr:carbohydrate ABC transporter permease [Nonomuraea sp. ATCC 55076]AQZ65793.1 sugar ABC transporter permease [Nonomuraea sp. ATCC 55076]SPL97215.1 binding-protein-dependent transport systems inner membrane component [Actinomadura parvosata subsp. kistnae]
MRFDSALGLESRRGPVATTGKIIIYTLMVVVFTGPLIGLLISAFNKTLDPTSFSLWPDEFTLENFIQAKDKNVYLYLLNSFIVVGFGLLLQMLVSVFAAYSLARKKFRGMTFVLLLMLTTMMLPEEIIAIPLSLVLSDLPLLHINLIGTYAGMILPVGAWGFSILVMTEFMKEVPVELEEAARIDGAGELRIFATIIVPLCRPALGVIGVFGFTMIWDQYLLPLIVAPESDMWTLPIALRSLRSDEEVGIGVLLAASLLALLPSIIAFLAFQRQFMRGLTSGAVKG